MRHLTIVEFGTYLGVTGNRLSVHNKDGKVYETALSRLRTIRIAKKGVSVSTDLLLALAARGIRLFVLDWRGLGVVALSGNNQHGVVSLRESQFAFLADEERCFLLAKSFIAGKISNQRSVILYFGKYHRRKDERIDVLLTETSSRLSTSLENLKNIRFNENWRQSLLGIEGEAAKNYWGFYRSSRLMPESFFNREGRGALEITNAALNYGYAILESYVWSAIDNAGLELFKGVLHQKRPGKPSLVLDVMEEYRSWVVDRNIVKLSSQISREEILSKTLKKRIVEEIDKTMTNKILWHGKYIRLENVLQRQIYKLSGHFCTGLGYKPLIFKW